MRNPAYILILIGAVLLGYGAMNYSRHRETVSVGPISATVQEQTSPVPLVLGLVAVAAGIGMLVSGRKNS